MARKRYWIGDTGPFFYDDAKPVLGETPTPVRAAIVSEGRITALEAPVEDEDVIRLIDIGLSLIEIEAQSFFLARIY